MGVFVGFFITPTTFLLQNAKMGLDASWTQRTAARNEAVNDYCADDKLALPFIDVMIPRGVESGNNSNAITNKLITNFTTCSEKDAEQGITSNQKFWKRMEDEASDFPDIIKDVGNKPKILAYEGSTRKVHQNMGMNGRVMTFYSYIPQVLVLPVWTKTSELLVPTDDTYTFEEAKFAAGHDKQIWAELPGGDARGLYEDVFPAK